MDAVHSGEDPGAGEPSVLLVGNKHAWSLGPAGPIVRAASIGFGLGLLVMTVVALFAR